MIAWAYSRIFKTTLLILAGAITITGCASSKNQRKPSGEEIDSERHSQTINGAAEILHSWHGDYPVAQLNLFPEGQRDQAVGFISDAKVFSAVWKVFKPGEALPEVDFKTKIILFARNTQFYNRISIGGVNVTNGVAEVLAMETMSAMPIEDKVAMSLVVVPRQGIAAIQIGGENIAIKRERDHRP
jgi:hypothetical protein